MVSFSVAKSSTTWPVLRRAAHIGVTVLAENHGPLCRQLSGPASERFNEVVFEITDDGAVMLAEGLAQFDCTICKEVEAGDHLIVLLQLHAVVSHSGGQPLVFHRSEFRKLGAAKPRDDRPTTSTGSPKASNGTQNELFGKGVVR
jgi:flavin reductase (DIM6/NTAB) family NADH-FMN oxidoreductase RutF